MPGKGQEISDMARQIRFDKSRQCKGIFKGNAASYTPAEPVGEGSEKELSDGAVIGVLEVDFPGDDASLPPRKFHIFVANEDGEWKGYAEADGEIMAHATKVIVNADHSASRRRAEFHKDAWSIRLGWNGFSLRVNF